MAAKKQQNKKQIRAPQRGTDDLPANEVSGTTQEDIDNIRRNAEYTPTPLQQGKPPADPLVKVEAPTTIKIKPDIKAKLDDLGEMFKSPDYNTTVARLIEFIPERVSTGEMITLVIPAHKFEWLKAKQSCTDATRLLINSVR